MTEGLEKSSNQENYTEELAQAWHQRSVDSLDKFFNEPGHTRSQLLDALWENGILDRIAPLNPAEKQARQALHKTVWDTGRNDPRLYWRILYSAGAALEASKRNYSVVSPSSSLVAGVVEGFNKALDPKLIKTYFPECIDKREINAGEIMFNEIMSRAQAELERCGQKPHTTLIPWGAQGSWQGIKFTVDRYTAEGKIWPQVADPRDYDKLYQLGAARGIPPEELNPGDFK